MKLSRYEINPNDDYLSKVIKYIPVEVTAAYVFISGLIAGTGQAKQQFAFNLAFIALLVITPLWIYFNVSGTSPVPQTKRKIFHAIIAEMALIIWVCTISSKLASELFNIMLDPTICSIVLALFTLVVPLLEIIFIPASMILAGAKADINPCDNPPAWPLAPAPTENPLATMAWATNTQKDKFGCTRDGGKKFHAGIDIKAKVGTECFATEDAKVEEVGYGSDLGKYVSISFKKDGKIYGVAYCHLSKQSVVKGAQVKAGDTLGETGVTGNADPNNPHLHLEVQDQVWVAYSKPSDRSDHGVNPNAYI